ncbi:hypothetical protein SOL50_10170, partial [Streptococcus thermophilus]|uniref:hypothetical protein n=1 Tax=Streptococcus thermophilus TaxID=1308 RepID=UPI002A69FC67
AFECWPRSRRLPGPGRITVAYGRPVSRDEMSGMEAKGILARIRGAIIDLQADVRRRMGRPALRYEREDE